MKNVNLVLYALNSISESAGWAKITGRPRPIFSNMAFSPDFVSYATEMGIKLKNWKDLDELVKLDEADIICDEVGNYFDSRGWENLSLDVRRWLTQGAKTGIEFYGGAQDFAQVDVAFRRLVQDGDLKSIRKIMGSRRPAKTKPPVKRIWGVCIMWDMDAQGYDEKNKTFHSGWIPSGIFCIRKKYCNIFDTNQKLLLSEPPLMKHTARYCEKHEEKGGDGSCRFCKVIHS